MSKCFRLLIEYIEDKDNPSNLWKGYVYAMGLLIVSMFKAAVLQYYFHIMDIVGFWVRSAVIGLVYEKVGATRLLACLSSILLQCIMFVHSRL